MVLFLPRMSGSKPEWLLLGVMVLLGVMGLWLWLWCSSAVVLVITLTSAPTRGKKDDDDVDASSAAAAAATALLFGVVGGCDVPRRRRLRGLRRGVMMVVAAEYWVLGCCC